ncbi:MAG TPA: Flp family type IVb pilin [Candidatus Elarobacter sp.]
MLLDDESAAARAEHDAASFRSIPADERGQGMAEYGLILAFIAILVIAALLYFSGNLQGMLSNVGSNI